VTPSPRARFASDFKSDPYWWEAARPESDLSPLPEAVDVLIVGSGYCGLTAAIELARNGRRVAVVDRDELGAGGSTRSGGMVSSGQKMVVTGAVKGLSQERVSRLLAESLQSFDYLKKLINDDALDADLHINGRFFGAYTPAHFERLKAQGQLLREKTGVTVHLIARSEQRQVLGSDYYHGGILVDNYGGLHVSKYHKALRGLARSVGVSLHSHAGVQRVENQGQERQVTTTRGMIRARHVIIATNGYTDAGVGSFIHRRVVPVNAYQIATAPLPRDLMEKLIPQQRMISDSQRNLYFFRPSPDGTRILFGSRVVIFDTTEERAAHKLYQGLVGIFPELNGVEISHSWKGLVGMTFDKRAHIGEQDGIHHAVGCNGNGVALMTYLGYRVARDLLNAGAERSAFDGGDFPSAAYYQGTPWFVPPATAMYEIGDQWDSRSRRETLS
jgi:glycine/D-amino acid oxidase-like deaminating enzyme